MALNSWEIVQTQKINDSLFGLPVPVSATSSSFPAACLALLLLGGVSCQKIWKFAVRRTLGKASSISFDTLFTNPWKHIGCLNPFMHRCNSISFERTAVKICNQWASIFWSECTSLPPHSESLCRDSNCADKIIHNIKNVSVWSGNAVIPCWIILREDRQFKWLSPGTGGSYRAVSPGVGTYPQWVSAAKNTGP